MKFKLFYSNEDVTQKDSTDSGAVLHGLDAVRDWIEKHETELLVSQSNLRSIQKAFPPRTGMRETTIQDNWEWPLVDSIDILSITSVSQGEDSLESFKIRGVIIRPDYIQFMSIPDVPMWAVVNEGSMTPMEKAIIGFDGKTVAVRQTLLDVMDAGYKSNGEPINTLVEMNPVSIDICVLNAENQIVGNVCLENFEGTLRLLYWETDDMEGEPANVITPNINYDPIYENGTLIPGIPD